MVSPRAPGTAGGPLDLPPLAATPAVTVVIPARGEGGPLRRAVASALAQDYPGSLEVVVAAAPGESLRVARELAAADARVRAVANPAGTTPAALNAGIAAAGGEVVARLDTHATLPAGYLARAVELLAATGAANVGGRQVPVGGTGFARAVAAAMRSPVGSGGPRYRTGGTPGEVETVYLGVFRRQAVEAVGCFNEALLRNQDYELNHRLRRAGGRVYFHPDLEVAYHPRATVADLWRQYLDYGRWKRVVIRMHPDSLRVRQLAAPALVAALAVGAAAALAGRWWPLAALLTAYAAILLVGAALATGRWRDVGPTGLALLVLHVAFGVGFLVVPTPRRARHPGETTDESRP